jgi:dTDP-4-amino-4,6-dideoxygalactose transaminase
MILFRDLIAEYNSIESSLNAAIRRVFDAGTFILGNEVTDFESAFASYCGCKFAVGVASGTEALQLALMASGITVGDEVILPAFTAAPTALAVSLSGATPVFVDIDPGTCTIDPGKISVAITKKTRAIIPVHLYGNVARMDSILTIAQTHKLLVIEDACQAHGAQFQDHKVGTLGDLGCFSFYPTKNLGAYGDGGMIVTNSSTLFERLKVLRNLGQKNRDQHVTVGLNSRLDELQASILSVKLFKLDQWNHRRQEISTLYDELLEPYVITLSKYDEAKPAYHIYTIRTEARNELQAFLHKQQIQTLIHYPLPLHMQEAFISVRFPPGSMLAAEQASQGTLSLPIYPQLMDKQVQTVADAVAKFFSKHR